MKHKLLVLAVLFTVLSCNKKKNEDPKPQEPVVVTPVAKTPKPYWPKMGTIKSESGLVMMCGWSVYEKWLRTDSSSRPIVDVYSITKKNIGSGGQVLSTEYTKEVTIWWASGAPQSNYMKFQTNTSFGFEQTLQELEKDGSCWYPYSFN
jgi:hypothetical protein